MGLCSSLAVSGAASGCQGACIKRGDHCQTLTRREKKRRQPSDRL